MTRCIVSAIVLALIAAHVAVAEEDLAAQIKAQQKERGKVLTELVEIRTAQCKVGMISCEFLLGAEADLVNAQMDATDKHEERIAVLERGVKRESEFLKMVEARFDAGLATQADVYRARSLILTTKIGLLKEGSPNDKVAAQIQALQKEQIEAVTQLVKLVTDEYRKGAAEFETLLSSDTALFNAQVSATDKCEASIAAMEAGVKRETVSLTSLKLSLHRGNWSLPD